MIDKLRADLLESRKSLEINLIWMFVARQTYTASENRKQMLKMMKQDKIEDIKSNCTSYIDGLPLPQKANGSQRLKRVLKRMPTSSIIVKRNTNLLKRTKILILENNELKYTV